MKEFFAESIYIKEVVRLAVIFLSRDGFMPKDEARKEIDLINEKIGLENLYNDPDFAMGKPMSYLTMSRIGRTHRMNRIDRVTFILTLDRAMEHAVYEVLHSGRYANHPFVINYKKES